MLFRRFALGFFAALAIAAPAAAQTFPSRPVKVVVPFPPGGGIDVLIRAIGQELSVKWQQPVVIENKPGANTFIGAEAVSKSAPDGYTLFATTDPTFTANRYLFKSMPYDPDAGFTPVMQLVRGDNMVLAHPSVPAKDLREFAALAKKDPKKYTYASYGNGTHPQLVFEYMNKREGLELLHVPYKGIAAVMLALTTNEVSVSTATAGVAGELMRGGKIKALAIAGPKRLANFPNVPTTIEMGMPYLMSPIWYGLFAPAGSPPAVVNKINADIRAILTAPAFAESHVTAKGLTVVASSPKALADAVRSDSALVGEMIRAAEVKPE